MITCLRPRQSESPLLSTGSDDVRDTPSAKIIRELNQEGYCNLIAYDPVAMADFQKYYQLEVTCVGSYEEILERADVLAITTAWPMFQDVKEKTDKPVADCRFML